MLFSERHGLRAVRMEPQLDSMDEPLRNGLWNVFHELVIERARKYDSYQDFMRAIWTEYYKGARDDFPREWTKYFKSKFADAPWHEVYDLVEMVSRVIPDSPEAFNATLERENAGYRVVGDTVSPIVDEVELGAVNSVLEGGGEFRLARKHIARAVELFSDRDSPDYRNAIKESISGAESAACVATGEKSFKDSLKTLKDRGLHPALGGVFNQLYGYTSDESGVRHALLEDSRVGAAEAHYMIVSCSAFISYLMQMK